MRIDGDESSNIEDRRGDDYGGGGGSGGGFGLPVRIGGRGLGVGTIAVALIASYFLGIDPGMVMSLLSGNEAPIAPPVQQHVPARPAQAPAPTDEAGRAVSKVLRTTEQVWADILKEGAIAYQPPKLVLFRRSTDTACGLGQSASGPFYCPSDQKVYLDLAFFDLMRTRFHAAGDFAEAYVIAHEVGHHVQNQLGFMLKAHKLQKGASPKAANHVSVQLELQADCFSGVWANRATRSGLVKLDPGDLQQALNAANRVGDDALQKQAQGRVVPDSFTHGSSAQRERWFRVGYDSGSVKACDTFSAKSL